CELNQSRPIPDRDRNLTARPSLHWGHARSSAEIAATLRGGRGVVRRDLLDLLRLAPSFLCGGLDSLSSRRGALPAPSQSRIFSAPGISARAARSRKYAPLRSAASGKFLSDRDVDQLIKGRIFHVGNSASAATVGDGGRNYSFSWLRPSFRALHDRQSSTLSSSCLNSRKFEVTTSGRGQDRSPRSKYRTLQLAVPGASGWHAPWPWPRPLPRHNAARGWSRRRRP